MQPAGHAIAQESASDPGAVRSGLEHNVLTRAQVRELATSIRTKNMQHRTLLPPLVGILFLTPILTFGQTASSSPASGYHEYQLNVSTSQAWIDTGIDLHAGDSLNITASTGQNCGPAGSSGVAGQDLPLPSAAPGALIAKMQAQEPPFLVGAGKELKVTDAGHLFLGVNTAGAPPCVGSFAVKISINPVQEASALANTAATGLPATPTIAPATNATTKTTDQPADIKKKRQAAAQVWLSGQLGTEAKTATSATNSNATENNTATATTGTPATALKVSDTPLDSALRKDIDGLPRRVNDQFKNEGDMVNFVLVGPEAQVQSALEAATWHLADTDVGQSAVRGILETYQKKDYLTMPMSQLYLFGRVQDFGYEEAEPYSVVASRHHFRLWKAPFTWNGQTVWVGAGTHDIGFEKDQRNGKLTHKIDPAVDGERDNIGQTLQASKKVKSLTYYLPPGPVKEAKNATGGGYHSDGRILVIVLGQD